MGSTAGGFRTWWRRLVGGSDTEADAELDNAHLMPLAGRFARRVRAWAAGNAVPVIDCTAGERKHPVAEEYLRTHSVGPGVFVILVARAPAMVWDVRRSADGTVLGNLARKRTYVNHCSFHIMDRQWGHLTIKMAGQAPGWASRPRPCAAGCARLSVSCTDPGPWPPLIGHAAGTVTAPEGTRLRGAR